MVGAVVQLLLKVTELSDFNIQMVYLNIVGMPQWLQLRVRQTALIGTKGLGMLYLLSYGATRLGLDQV